MLKCFPDANDNPDSHQNLLNSFWPIYNVPWNLHANSFPGICIKSTNEQAKSMRKHLIPFTQVIKFCKISSSRRAGFNPNPPPCVRPWACLWSRLFNTPGVWSAVERQVRTRRLDLTLQTCCNTRVNKCGTTNDNCEVRFYMKHLWYDAIRLTHDTAVLTDCLKNWKRIRYLYKTPLHALIFSTVHYYLFT